MPDGVELMERSLANKDRSALFFMLAADRRLTQYKNFETSLDQILKDHWNVTIQELKIESQTECTQLLNDISAINVGGIKNFIIAIQHNLQLKYAGAQSMLRLPEFKLPATILRDENLFNVFTFNFRGAVLEHNIFDPRPHMERFFRIEESVRKNGKFTSFGPQCFVEE